MKYLIVLLLVMVVAWRWRTGRSSAQQTQRRQRAARDAATPQDMVRCAQCGVHLPQSDALPGKRGAYCCSAHRQKAEP